MSVTENGETTRGKLAKLLREPALWRASSLGQASLKNTSTGFEALDRHLPGAGWPSDGITELLSGQYGIGEFRLLLPAMSHLSRYCSRWLVMVRPPYIPYPPTLVRAGVALDRLVICQPGNQRDYLWTLEKALASGSCSVVLGWPARIDSKQIRRLQVASRNGNTWGILFRHEKVAVSASPADLRIRIRPAPSHRDASAVLARILKRRGGWESDDILLHFDDELQRPMPDFSEMIVPRRTPEADPEEHSEPAPATRPVRYDYQ